MKSEGLARAFTGGLTYDTASWDRLTAMALGSIRSEQRSARESLLNSLGVSLIGFKHAHRPDMLQRAIDDLRDCMRWRLKTVGRRERTSIARAAIKEWTVDICPVCSGSAHIFDSFGVERLCGTCQGSRKRRYSDEERAEATNAEDGAKLARAFDVAHAQIAFAVGFAIRQAQERLRD